MSRIRAEVEGAGGGYIIHVDPPQLTETQRAIANGILTDLIDDLRQEGIADAEGVLAVLVTERIAEDRAYRREAERRGVLAL